jgi:glycerol-1-phosphate dehydrogenase [NAD(P)+]
MTKLIPEIYTEISHNLINNLEKYLTKLSIDISTAIFVSDHEIWQNNQRFFSASFLNKCGKTLILSNPQADDKNVDLITSSAKNFKFIIAFGSGTINDLCKYSAKELNINYLIIASALSMNGFASKTASISINQHKKSLLAILPVAILADYKILKNAPSNMNKAGLADVLCFYACNFDLLINQLIFLQKNHQPAIKIQQKLVKNFTKNYSKYQYNDKVFLKKLFAMILISGYAMTIANSSAPASQSEHLMAHVLTMKYPQLTNKYLHGEIIANTTILALQIQENFLMNFDKKIENFLLSYDKFLTKNFELELINYFNQEIAIECLKEIELKQKFLTENKLKIEKNLQKNSLNIYKKLQKNLITNDFLIEIFEHFSIDFIQIASSFSSVQIEDIKKFSAIIRNKFTVLDFSNK